MKPRCLTLQAFGPFAGREVIDFTKIPSDALFLIHGPTGAGKSTLLDGICYALYGETSGDERQPKEMRSHHAANNVQTEVELDFELGAKRFRIKRIPEQERTATTGVARPVKIASKAELYQWNGTEWKLLATKAGEVANHVVRELGFEADQFRQVIMLPQGQFRKLLSADSKDREKILEALFNTENFKRLQERLQASAQALRDRASDAEGKRATLLQQAEAESEEALAQIIAGVQQTLETLTTEASQRRNEAATAQGALSAGEALAAKFNERAAAQEHLAKLNAADAAIATDRGRHDLALRAQHVVPAWASVSEARNLHKESLAKATQASVDADKATQEALTTAAVLDAEEKKAPERESAVREIGRLEESRTAVIRLNEAAQVLKESIRQRDALSAETSKLDQQIKAQSQQRTTLAQQIESLAPVAGRTEVLKLEVERQEQRLKTLHQITLSEANLSKLRGETSKSQAALATAQTGLGTARQFAAELDSHWRAGQAAVLASYLAEGAPCPVCGSHEHPLPAEGDAEIPTETQLALAAEQVTKAEAAVEKARKAEQATAQKMSAADATLKAQRDSLGSPAEGAQVTVAIAETDLSRRVAERDQALKAATDLATARTALTACEQQQASAQQTADTARTKLAEAAARVAAAESVWSERAAQVPEDLRDPAALESAVAKAKAALEALTKRHKQAQLAHQSAQSKQAATVATLKTLTEGTAACNLRLQAAQAALLIALTGHGFADESAFAAARMTPDEIGKLAEKIHLHDQSLAAARERLARAEAAVAGAQAPDLKELNDALNAAKSNLETVLAKQSMLKEKIAEKARTAEMLQQIRAELGDIAACYKVMGTLADIANGKNGANLTFQRYVLASLLDDVLRQASQRLRKMTSNRYTLQRFKDVSDKRRAAGLDIEVFDEQTGTARSANTLSGGEGFMASLSLALGLSDVVQSYAGGIQLDTLFIDEGFGTLDPESLDMAMKALIELQQKGRLVGIISHVDELKQQLEHGIEIRSAVGGSSVRVGAIAG